MARRTHKAALMLAATATVAILALVVEALFAVPLSYVVTLPMILVSMLLAPVVGIMLAVDTTRMLRARAAAGSSPDIGFPSGEGADRAVATALAARQRRANSRQLVERDPLLAADLRIGRPDLPSDYDDGGLVDLNHAPAAVIAQVCGIDSALAERIAAARAAGSFLTVDDVLTLVDLPVDCWARVRDRAVLITS